MTFPLRPTFRGTWTSRPESRRSTTTVPGEQAILASISSSL
jgi:hypothetical protein